MNTLLHLFQTGGFMMYPLLLASIIAVAIAVERLRLYRLATGNLALMKTHLPSLFAKHRFEDARQVCEKAGGAAGELLSAFLTHREHVGDANAWLELEAQQRASRLKERLNYLSAIVTLAPLLGLLGTVTGMIQAFDVLSISEGQPFAITGGVAEALVATAFGLFVAILAMVLYVVLEQKATRLIAELEDACGLFRVSQAECKKDVVELAAKIVDVQQTRGEKAQTTADACPVTGLRDIATA